MYCPLQSLLFIEYFYQHFSKRKSQIFSVVWDASFFPKGVFINQCLPFKCTIYFMAEGIKTDYLLSLFTCYVTLLYILRMHIRRKFYPRSSSGYIFIAFATHPINAATKFLIYALTDPLSTWERLYQINKHISINLNRINIALH